jgi:hypothetical protein
MYTYFYCRRAKAVSPAMAPRKASKANVEVLGQGSDNVIDTSPRSVNSIRTWSFVSDVLQSELVDYSDDSSDNEKYNLTTKYKIVVQSGMHKVAARPRLLPYYDMVQWALDHVDIPTRTIINEQKVTIGTFRPEQLQAMYKLPTVSDLTYNAEFLENFKQKEYVQYDKTMSILIRDWVSHPVKFRADSNGIYSIASLELQFKYVAMMTCRLYGKEDTTHFFLQWVTLIHSVTKGCSFDWDKMLSDSLTSRVTEYRAQRESGKIDSCWTTEKGSESVVTMLKQLCFF